MPRSSRFALFVLLFLVLIFAGLAGSQPRGVDAASPDFGRAALPPAGRDTLRAAFGLSFGPSRSLLTAPVIDAVSPTSVARSGLITIDGESFGSAQGTSQLTVGGASALVVSWSDARVVAYVPEAAADGDVTIELTTAEGTAEAQVDVTTRQQQGRLRWGFTLASDPAPHRPAVAADGTVYVQDVAGRLYALTPDGGLKWIFKAGAGGGRAPLSVGADGTVYAAGSTPKDPAQTCYTANLTEVDAVFAVNPAGTEKWVFKQTCQRLIAGPTVGPDGKIYGATEQGGLGAFALTDEGDEGTLAWNNGTFSEPQSKGREVVFGPTSADGAAAQSYLQFSQTGLDFQGRLFFRTLAGAEVRRIDVAKGSQPAVGILTGNIFTTTGTGAGSQIRSWAPQGAHRWFSNVYPERTLTELDAAPDETLYVAQDGYYLHALSPASGGINWTYYEANAVFSAPAASPDGRGLALFGGYSSTGPGSGYVNAVGNNGKLLWKQPLPDAQGLFPGGQARVTARARFTSDAGSAYAVAETARDETLDELEKRGRLFALDTSVGDIATNVPPVLTLTNPVDKAIFAQNQNIELTVETDPAVTPARVDFYRISGNVYELVGSDFDRPYAVPFNTGQPGQYKIEAVATDTAGFVGYSAVHSITVVNEGPRVSIVSPADRDVFPYGAPITIKARATDIDGHVTQVEFTAARGGNLGTDTTPDADGNYSVEYTPTEFEQGTQQVWAYATDDDGVRGAAWIHITVSGAPTPTPTPTPTPEETPTPSPTPTPTPGLTPTPTPPGNPPTVRVVAPAHGSSFAEGSAVQISVEALDSDGTVASVKIFRSPSGALLGTDTAAPFTFSLTDASPNVYDLYAVAADNVGHTATSAVVQVVFYDAEAPYFVNGRIRHSQSTSGNFIHLPHALVRLEKDGAPFREARTDALGNYTFDHLAQGGSYRVVPSEPGYTFSPSFSSIVALDDSRTFDFVASGPLPPAPRPQPTPGAVVEWERFNDNGQNTNDLNPVLTVDLAGNTVVATQSYNRVDPGQPADSDISVVKYDPAGQKLWSKRYAGPGLQLDNPVAVRTDANGNIYVFGTEFGGYSSWYNFVTVKYAPDGTQLWARTYNGPAGRWDTAVAMELDAAGNVVVTGYSETTYPDAQGIVNDYATLKYDPMGNQKWVNRYSTAHVNDRPADITADALGNVYVTGTAATFRGANSSDALTIKYTPSGARAWVAQYNGKAGVNVHDAAVVVRHDGKGGLFVAGESQPGSTYYDFFVAKYNDATGALLWSRNWAGPHYDNLKDMAVDALGAVVLTGESDDRSVPSSTGPNYDVATVKFDGAGNQLWARTFAGAPGKWDTPRRILLDAVGNAYVAVRTDAESNMSGDTAVIKYLADGAEGWVHRYDTGRSHRLSDAAINIAGSVYATGHVSVTAEDGARTTDVATFKLLATSPGLNSPPDVTLADGPTIVGSPEPDAPQPNGPTIVGRSLTLHATASDRDGVVTRVDFYAGTVLLGTDTDAPYSFTWENPAPGTHAVTAHATDYFGVTASSPVVNVTVSGDPTPTPTPTPTPEPSPTPIPTPTVTPTPVPTPSPTPIPTPTPTPELTPTPTPEPTPTPTPLPTPTPTPVSTPTPTPSPTSTPLPTPSPTPEAQTFVVTDAPPSDEESAAVVVTVRRTGDLSQAAGVDYVTADGTAREGYDYIMASGTLLFAPGESARQVRVLLVNDAHGEQAEAFTLALSNPWGGCSLGTPHAAALTIRENDATSAGANPVDEAAFFVYGHYADFLNREADASGRQFWTGEIESCGADTGCREVKRINVSAAFFLSIEFQQTGYLAYRARKAAFGDLHGKPVPVTREEMLRDMRAIGSEVIVNADGWQEKLELNKQAYFEQLVASQRFTVLYPAALTAEQYVDALNANAGSALSQGERDTLVAELKGDLKTRAQVLRAVAEDSDLSRAEFKKAFVLMQYFGYLRRNPDEGPDSDFGGWRFWLSKLDEFGGDFVRAEMVKAFLNSDEYRKRFGQ